jgi:Family of unknown function (DUF5677)
MSADNPFPDPPIFTEAEIEDCRRSGDYRPILFEWYKYTAIITNVTVRIEFSSPAIKGVAKPQFGALIGMLNRCSRLMLANVALSHKGKFGETTALIDRCIFESAVKVLWLCKQNSDESFGRYFAEGLKTELALKREIQQRIAERGNQTVHIEERMLKSIERYIGTSGMSESEIASSKKLPDLASMIENLGQDRLAYVVGQKIGSHHIHGTWPSLLAHYLEWGEDDLFHPRDHNCSTHVDQFISVSLMVLDANKFFCAWLMDMAEAQALIDMLQAIEDEILLIYNEVVGSDFNIAVET